MVTVTIKKITLEKMSQKNKVPEIVLKALKQSLSMDSKSRGERNRDEINALSLTGGP